MIALGQALCKNEPNTPSIAFLVGGLARDFAQPIRYLSLKRNIIEAFGLPRHRFDLLLYLKNFDYGPPSSKWHAGGLHGRNRSTFHANRPTALDKAMEILQPAAVRILSDMERDARHILSLEREHNRTCVARIESSRAASLGNVSLARLPQGLGLWDTLDQLWAMLIRQEQKRGDRYEQVMFLRPDLVHFLSMGPYCLYRRDTVYSSTGDDCGNLAGRTKSTVFRQKCMIFSSSDFWFLGPRAYAKFILGTLNRILSCRQYYGWNEDVFVRDGKNAARALGFRYHGHRGMLGASFIQRRVQPRLSVQGIGAAVESVVEHVDLDALLYNSTSRKGRLEVARLLLPRILHPT